MNSRSLKGIGPLPYWVEMKLLSHKLEGEV